MSTQQTPNPPTFEYHGIFEEVLDLDTRKCLGTRDVPNPDPERPISTAGDREIVVTEPFELQRGYKTIVVQASPAKPRRLLTRYLHKCGRMLRPVHESDKLRAACSRNLAKYTQ